MSKIDSVQDFWVNFCESNPKINLDTPFQVWYFGLGREDALELCDLVLQGKKTATASLVWEYEEKPEDAPVLDGYSVVTDFDGNPKCVVQTTELRVLPFNQVDAKFAFDEGEGDRTLEYWRTVHRKFFTECCLELGIEFDESMMICCKRFKKLFPKL
jgi:uncharacterized protein YhfF